MNALIQAIIVGAIVAAAAAFVVVRIVNAVRGKQPSCCSDRDDEPESPPWMSPCEGCAGCSDKTKTS